MVKKYDSCLLNEESEICHLLSFRKLTHNLRERFAGDTTLFGPLASKPHTKKHYVLTIEVIFLLA